MTKTQAIVLDALKTDSHEHTIDALPTLTGLTKRTIKRALLALHEQGKVSCHTYANGDHWRASP